ncbi:hypothetical protein PR048_031032 [Dryococelus australis]|uniref:Uncharacterized protein n=1 Tax=Dryococelus australis TaxID=614101 RepID=A0ABQ9G451_9NEOP|nr:hypothetical protein PR048_031032 [Dryococelus australis]
MTNRYHIETNTGKKPADKTVMVTRVMRGLVAASQERGHCKELLCLVLIIVQARIDRVQDLVAAEAKYHKLCNLQFFSSGTRDGETDKRGRPEDKNKKEAFCRLKEFTARNYECQFLLDELVTLMESFSKSSSTYPCSYSRYYMKEKLK